MAGPATCSCHTENILFSFTTSLCGRVQGNHPSLPTAFILQWLDWHRFDAAVIESDPSHLLMDEAQQLTIMVSLSHLFASALTIGTSRK